MLKPSNFTKEEQKEAINKVVKLLNDYKLTILTEQIIKIVPLEIKEAKDEGK